MKAVALSIPALKVSVVIFEDEAPASQLLQHSVIGLFVRADDRVQMDPSGQVAERRGVAAKYLGNEFIDVVTGGNIELSHELPVYGVLNNDVFYQASVVDEDPEFFRHILRSVTAGDPADDSVARLCQDIAPGRRGYICARWSF